MNAELSTPPRTSHRWWLIGLSAAALLFITLFAIWLWTNRPIKPVVLTPAEKTVVEQKVEALQPADHAMPVTIATGETEAAVAGDPAGPVYEKGSREILFTERELNGLLNERTSLGESVKFQLARNAVHARVEADLPADLPLVGGKRLKVRARFLIGGDPGGPSFVLDDVSVWGISLPNAWLGGLKGINLLGDLLGAGDGGSAAGIEEFRIEPGKLLIRLAE